MKHMKIIAAMLVLALILSSFAVTANAADAVGFNVTVSPSDVKPGEQVEVIVSLTGYTTEAAEADALRGLQVDITGVDTSVLSVVEYTSLIEDTTAISNTASYNEANKRVRLAYVQMSGTLPAPCEYVFKVVFQVNSDLTESGSITLPVTVKMQTVSQQITLTGECTINYSVETSSVTSVDITWGAMEYEYTDGAWNTQTHSYDGAGWADNGSGFVTVKNTGTSSTTAAFFYSTDRSDITGSFTDGTTAITGAVDVASGMETTVYLVLSGKPAETLSSTKIGTVTVTIGGE